MSYDTYDRTARSLADHAEDAARSAGVRSGRGDSTSRALQATGGDLAATALDAADSLGGRIKE